MSHEHNECNHDDLRFCKQCDVAYCQNCSKEWGAGISYQPQWNYSPPPFPNPWVGDPPWPVTSGGTGDPLPETVLFSHAH